MLKRNGVEKWCGECRKYQHKSGFRKSMNSHKHICALCAEKEKQIFHQVQAG